MPNTASQIADLLERIARDAMAQLENITPDDLNHTLALPESNTLFALATHLVSSGEYWTLVRVGKREIARDRSADFYAAGCVDDLLARYKRWIQSVHELLDTFPDERLNEPIEPMVSHSAIKSSTYNIREALLHAVEHSALHLGHIQLTRQFLGYAPPADWKD
ncbi:MAG: DinB family protein [Ktedonobacteraceae bacterium]